MANLLRLVDHAATGERLIGFHASSDEEGDAHYPNT